MKQDPTMNDHYIVTVYVLVDDLLKSMLHQTDVRATCSDAEILTVAIVAAQYFQNHHERTLCLLQRLGDLGKLSVSRFNRRLHELADVGYELGWLVSELWRRGKIYIIDNCPIPVCKRSRKVQGKALWLLC